MNSYMYVKIINCIEVSHTNFVLFWEKVSSGIALCFMFPALFINICTFLFHLCMEKKASLTLPRKWSSRFYLCETESVVCKYLCHELMINVKTCYITNIEPLLLPFWLLVRLIFFTYVIVHAAVCYYCRVSLLCTFEFEPPSVLST